MKKNVAKPSGKVFLPNRLSHQNCSNCVPISLYSNNKSATLNQIEHNFALLKEKLDEEVKIRKEQEEVRAQKNQLKNRCAVYSFVFLVMSFFLKLIVNI